jgi:CubicO group peptidase (beta-lactamase class C family)
MMGLEANRPMAKNAISRLASMTKPVTAVAVLMLVDSGRIHLSDPVSRFIPALKGTKVMTERAGSTGAARGVFSQPGERLKSAHGHHGRHIGCSARKLPLDSQ